MDPMQVFARVVETGSFSAAAQRLDLSPSAISKLISRLEDRLGVRLFHRTTRRLSLTPEGETYLAGAQFILGEIAELEASIGQTATRPQGLLRVSVGSAFATHQLMDKLPLFLDRYPDVAVNINVSDRAVDLHGEGIDLAIRSGPLPEGSLIARKIADFERVICAAPAYLQKRGAPRKPQELADHDCLLVSEHPSLSRWPFRHQEGVRDIEIRSRVSVSSADALTRLALAGAGIVRVGDLLVADALRSGALIPLLEEFHLVEPVPIAALYPTGRHRAPKLKVFVDFLLEQFRHAPWRLGRNPPSPAEASP